MRLVDADELKKCAIPCEIHNGALTELCVPLYQIDNAIKTIKAVCKEHNTCVECPMNRNCNEHPANWKETEGGAE